MYFGLSLWRMKSIVSVPAYFSHACDRQPSSLHVNFFHNGASFFNRSLYPKTFSVVSHCVLFSVGFTVVAYFGVSIET